MAEFKTLNIAGTYNGFEAAVHGMRQPLKSFHKADSYWGGNEFILGDNDRKLARGLRKAGSEHCKYLRMIPVWADITAPETFWTEFDTYKVGTTANSTSTMHTIHRDGFEAAFDFPYDLDDDASNAFDSYIKTVSSVRDKMNAFEKGGDEYNKYHDLICKMLPRCFKYTRTICLNYAVLASMYHQRKDHRKSDWNTDFVNWVKTLPYNELITGDFE